MGKASPLERARSAHKVRVTIPCWEGSALPRDGSVPEPTLCAHEGEGTFPPRGRSRPRAGRYLPRPGWSHPLVGATRPAGDGERPKEGASSHFVGPSTHLGAPDVKFVGPKRPVIRPSGGREGANAGREGPSAGAGDGERGAEGGPAHLEGTVAAQFETITAAAQGCDLIVVSRARSAATATSVPTRRMRNSSGSCPRTGRRRSHGPRDPAPWFPDCRLDRYPIVFSRSTSPGLGRRPDSTWTWRDFPLSAA